MNSSILSTTFLLCSIIATAAAAADARYISNDSNKCRTRFTFTRPTNENASSILFGVTKKQDLQHKQYDNSSHKISFNHDEVGITQPDTTNHEQQLFPACRGLTKKIKKDLKLNEGCSINDDTTNVFSSRTLDGWRILRFQKRVGYGKKCYTQVQKAILDWDFETRKGKKSMGILSAAASKKTAGSSLNEAPWFTVPRRNLLATFTEVCFPKPLKSLFVVSPVHVVYEVKNACSIPKCMFSSTAYATLSDHLLAGEERASVIWRKDMGDEVDIEIVSFSRSAPSIGGKIVWPLIGRMQKQFFLSEMDHLDKVAQS